MTTPLLGHNSPQQIEKLGKLIACRITTAARNAMKYSEACLLILLISLWGYNFLNWGFRSAHRQHRNQIGHNSWCWWQMNISLLECGTRFWSNLRHTTSRVGQHTMLCTNAKCDRINFSYTRTPEANYMYTMFLIGHARCCYFVGF